MRSRVITVAAAVGLGLSLIAPAVAVDASPDPWSPKVHFKARDSSPQKGSGASGRSGFRSTYVDRGRDTRCAFADRYERTFRCGARGFTPRDPAPQPAAPTLTPGAIRQAVREVEMPRLRVQVQPSDRTLVNVETIFWTEPRRLRRTVDLLGHSIEVQATPTSYTWHGGDGSRRTTTEPGRPYPPKDVTHRYAEPAKIVRPRVDTTYRVRYRVDGGTWQGLGEPLTAAGPSGRLRVDEAAPVLVRP